MEKQSTHAPDSHSGWPTKGRCEITCRCCSLQHNKQMNALPWTTTQHKYMMVSNVSKGH